VLGLETKAGKMRDLKLGATQPNSLSGVCGACTSLAFRR